MMMIYQTRGKRALTYAVDSDCNSIAALLPHNVFYLTGFWGEAIFVQGDDGRFLIVPALEIDRAKRDSSDSDVQVLGADRGLQMFELFWSITSKKKVSVDNADYRAVELLKKKSTVKSGDAVERARAIKDENEISRLVKGGMIMDAVIEVAIKKLKEGISERELDAIIVKEYLDSGADLAYYAPSISSNIVSFEENTAYPHHSPTDKKLKKDNMVLLDLTLRYAGYIVDTTRTISFGRTNKEKREVYELVKLSQQAGINGAKPGTSAKQLDANSRSLLGDYAKYFIHSLGHGIGVEVHELPYISQSSDSILQEGVAMTVEPGIYLPGKFGVRIEDSLIVKKGGPLLLNNFNKELIEA